jgi:TetR/AcrR family transcriptional regulator, regulator of autoinduction and epiphytic fitness
MEDVARAAGVSRQGLYLHYATKEDLFRAAVQHLLDNALGGALARLAEEDQPLEDRLVGAFDAWLGQFAGAITGDAADLEAATQELVAPLIAEKEEVFVAATTAALQSSGLGAAYEAAGLTPGQLAQTLYATARGLKHRANRAEFVEGMTVAVRALCLPQRAQDDAQESVAE